MRIQSYLVLTILLVGQMTFGSVEETGVTVIDYDVSKPITVSNGAQASFKGGAKIRLVKVNDSAAISISEGADVSRVLVAESGRVKVDNAKVSDIHSRGTGELAIGGGSKITRITMSENSLASIAPGTDISHVRLSDNAYITVEGGSVSYIQLAGNSTAEIHDVELTGGGFFSEDVRVRDGGFVLEPSTKLVVYGCELTVKDGVLKGYLAGKAFSAWIILSDGAAKLPKYRLPKTQPPQVEISQTHSSICNA